VVYASSSSALATGSALTFNGTETLALTASGGAALNVGASTGKIFLYADNSGTTLGALTDIPLRFSVNGSETFRTTSSSLYTASGINVGIGTSSPAYKLDVNSDSSRIAKATTGYAFSTIGNTSGSLYIGVENSTGNTLFTGSTAYAALVGSGSAYPLQFATNNIIRATLDTSGNLGLGVTPSAWGAFKAFEMQGGSYFATYNFGGLYIGENNYYNGSNFIYKTTAAATHYLQGSGVHAWYTAASGTAGNAISFTQAMTLNASGNLGIGTTSVNPTGLAILSGGQGKGVLVARNASGSPTSGQSLGSYAFKGIMDGANSNVSSEAMIEAVAAENQSGSTAATSLVFYTKPSGTGPGSAPTERVRITSDGKLLVGTTTSPGSAKLVVAGGLSVNNNTDDATSSDAYGNFFAKNAGSVSPSTTTTIKNATGSESAMYLVSGVNSGLGIRFFDIVVTLTASVTPVVVSTGSINAPPARTYSMSGENLQVNFGGANSFVIYVTGMGANEAN
jgi:hypothetical protein